MFRSRGKFDPVLKFGQDSLEGGMVDILTAKMGKILRQDAPNFIELGELEG
jgi:hypothetical protein